MHRNTSIAAAAIIRHVHSGGWLGAAWPQYVRGLPRQFSPRKAMEAALKRCWYLHEMGNYNFRGEMNEV